MTRYTIKSKARYTYSKCGLGKTKKGKERKRVEKRGKVFFEVKRNDKIETPPSK